MSDDDFTIMQERFERERAALRKRIKEERKAVNALRGEAALWKEAKTIRAYVAAVEAQTIPRTKQKARKAWAAWARDQADWLDPLSESPPTVLDTPIDQYRERCLDEYIEDDGSIGHA